MSASCDMSILSLYTYLPVFWWSGLKLPQQVRTSVVPYSGRCMEMEVVFYIEVTMACIVCAKIPTNLLAQYYRLTLMQLLKKNHVDVRVTVCIYSFTTRVLTWNECIFMATC